MGGTIGVSVVVRRSQERRKAVHAIWRNFFWGDNPNQRWQRTTTTTTTKKPKQKTKPKKKKQTKKTQQLFTQNPNQPKNTTKTPQRWETCFVSRRRGSSTGATGPPFTLQWSTMLRSACSGVPRCCCEYSVRPAASGIAGAHVHKLLPCPSSIG